MNQERIHETKKQIPQNGGLDIKKRKPIQNFPKSFIDIGKITNLDVLEISKKYNTTENRAKIIKLLVLAGFGKNLHERYILEEIADLKFNSYKNMDENNEIVLAIEHLVNFNFTEKDRGVFLKVLNDLIYAKGICALFDMGFCDTSNKNQRFLYGELTNAPSKKVEKIINKKESGFFAKEDDSNLFEIEDLLY